MRLFARLSRLGAPPDAGRPRLLRAWLGWCALVGATAVVSLGPSMSAPTDEVRPSAEFGNATFAGAATMLTAPPPPPVAKTAGEAATAGVPLGLLEANPLGRPGTTAVGSTLPGNVPTLRAGALDGLVFAAYQKAVRSEAASDRGCGLSWPVLAAIGRVESDNGQDVPPGGGITSAGTIEPPILGPALDGGSGFAAIRSGGSWARATGPMQFIPSTWASWGADGNADGSTNPNNIFDASLAAAHYLCAGSGSLTEPRTLAAAIYSYNHSVSYVRTVLGLVAAYEHASPTQLISQANLPEVAPGYATEPFDATVSVASGVPVAGTPLGSAAVLDVVTPAGHGVASAQGGTLQYLPAAGFVGEDFFTYGEVGTSARGTITVKVTAPGTKLGAAISAHFTENLNSAAGVLTISGADTATLPASGAGTLLERWAFTAARTGAAPISQLAVHGSTGSGPWRVVRTALSANQSTIEVTRLTTCVDSTCAATVGPLELSAAGARIVAAGHSLTVTATAAGVPSSRTIEAGTQLLSRTQMLSASTPLA